MAGAAGRRASATRNRRVRGHRAAKLKAGLIDEIHLALAPTLLGRGEALLTGIDMIAAGFRCTQHVSTPRAMHVVLTKGQDAG